jgi:hypothetical protein
MEFYCLLLLTNWHDTIFNSTLIDTDMEGINKAFTTKPGGKVRVGKLCE